MSAKTARVICTGRFHCTFSLQSKRRSPDAVLFHHLREAYGLFPAGPQGSRRRRDPGLFLQQAHGLKLILRHIRPPARPAHHARNLYGLAVESTTQGVSPAACCRATRNATAVCVSHRYPSASYRARISSRTCASSAQPQAGLPDGGKHFGGHGNAHAPPAHASIPPPLPHPVLMVQKRRSRFEDTRMSMDGEDVL